MPKLSNEGQALLSQILPRLEALVEGESILITDTPTRLLRIRSQLYRHTLLSGLQGRYKLTFELPTQLRLLRRDLAPATQLSTPQAFERSEAFLGTIVDLAPPEAKALAREALEAGRLTDAEFLRVMDRYEEIANE